MQLASLVFIPGESGALLRFIVFGGQAHTGVAVAGGVVRS